MGSPKRHRGLTDTATRTNISNLMTLMFACRPIKIQYLWLHWGLTDTATRTKHMDRGTKCCTAIFHWFPLSTFYFLSTFALSHFFSLLIIPMLLQTVNVLLFDAPVGAGFSFATTSEVRSLERIRHKIGSSSLSVSEKCECNWWYIYIYIYI